MICRIALLMLSLVVAGCASTPTALQDASPAEMVGHPDLYIVVTLRNEDPGSNLRAGSTLRGYQNASAYSVGSIARSAVRGLTNTYRLREVSSWPIAMLGVHCVVFQVAPGQAVPQTIVRLRQDPRVESVQPLQTFATQSTVYNDPYERLQSSLDTMGIPAAHEWSRGAGVHVAVIDTGVDTRHPDLQGRVVEKRNFVDGDWQAFDNDRHGTAVAGLIAATANNALGIVGIAPEASLHVYKACWQIAAGDNAAVCNTFTLAKALSAAIDARVQITNLSLAGPGDPLLTRLIAQASLRGMIVVGAAPADRRAAFPTDIDGVIAVAAVDQQAAARSGSLAAPGTEVLTLVPDGHYDFASGSSIATANVSGVIALLLARQRVATSGGLVQLLGATALSRSVNAAAALCVVVHDPTCSDLALTSSPGRRGRIEEGAL
ncbi:MAG: S8 family serine peptidase [Steroidobacteraceae bacterium]